MSEYPEHDKLTAVKDKTHAIGEFLEWVQDKYDGQLMTYVPASEMGWEYGWAPLRKSTLDLLAEWAGVDQRELEREKRAMFEKMRELNEERDDGAKKS